MPRTPETPADVEPVLPKYIQGTEDAARTAAYKINVVIGLINTFEDDDSDDGGYTLSIAEDLLRSIRDELRESVAKSEKEQQERQTAGGVR